MAEDFRRFFRPQALAVQAGNFGFRFPGKAQGRVLGAYFEPASTTAEALCKRIEASAASLTPPPRTLCLLPPKQRFYFGFL